MSIIIFIIVLAVLILVHEFGHFIFAKKSGTRVEEFGIGFPPRICGKKIGETTYSINWIPFGGFVKIFGENNEEIQTEEDKKVSFVYKKAPVKALILFAGVLFNWILAWLLIVSIFLVGMPVAEGDPTFTGDLENVNLTVTSISPDSPAALSGLKAGDKVLSLRTGNTELLEPSPEEMQAFVASLSGQTIEIEVLSGEGREVFEIIPADGIIPDRAVIGVSLANMGTLKLPILKAIVEGTKTTWMVTKATVLGYGKIIKDIFTGNGGVVLESVSGPVGIAGLVGDAASLGVVPLLMLSAIISISLAVINLLPFPALDGGRLLFLLIETIKGSPINSKAAGWLNGLGFLLLITLMIIVTVNDVVKLF